MLSEESIILLTLLLCAVVIVVFCRVGSSFGFVAVWRTGTFSFIMTSRSTNNSSQSLFDESSASVAASVPQSTDVGDSAVSAQTGSSSSAFLSPEIVALIAQSIQAAMTAKQAKSSSSPATSISSGAIGGVPAIATPAAVVAQPSAGRPVSTSSVSVPSFLSTFTAPALPVLSLAASAASSLGGSSHVASKAVASVPSPASIVADQPFVVGPGVSPVPAKLVSQIMAGKYVDLCDLLPANLQVREPEPHFLFDNRLVLTSQPEKSSRRIEDIPTWTEAFAIFPFILVSHFPHRWRDLLQYQLLILRTHRHFSGRVWLAYDRAFRGHAAATQLTDWSGMNAQLFNFHAAGASFLSPSSNDPSDWEPTGSSGSIVVCKSWNRGLCTSPLYLPQSAPLLLLFWFASCSGMSNFVA